MKKDSSGGRHKKVARCASMVLPRCTRCSELSHMLLHVFTFEFQPGPSIGQSDC